MRQKSRIIRAVALGTMHIAATSAQQFDLNSYSDVMLMCAATAKAVHGAAGMRDVDIPATETLRLLGDAPYFKLPLFEGSAEEVIEFIYGVGASLDPDDVSYFYYKGCSAEAAEHFQK